MSQRLANQVKDLGHRYIAGWADSANKRRGGTGGAVDSAPIFSQGQADGTDPRVSPEATMRHVSNDLEAAIVARFRYTMNAAGPMFLQLEVAPQMQALYKALEALADEILDTGKFVPVPTPEQAKAAEPAPEPEPAREPLFKPGQPFGS